jgi:class III poly(R)-hydroxyalkanoic acid synthase PhaE subunit
MKTATESWLTIAKAWTGPFTTAERSSTPDGESEKQKQESRQAGFQDWQKVFATMHTMAGMDPFLGRVAPFPEMTFKMVQNGWEGCFNLYKHWSKATKSSKESKTAGDLEGAGRKFLEMWLGLYEKEIRPILNAPQLGLTRSYQERMNRFLDKFHGYQAAIAEFMQLLNAPIERSLRDMESMMEKAAGQGKLSGDDFRDYYNFWIKSLESDYMALLQSPEYIGTLSRTLTAVQDFNVVRDEMLVDLLQALPIPTNRDMDELYKELYQLKKMVKEVSAKMQHLESYA